MKTSKKLVPQLRFPEFEGGWETKKISEALTLLNGYAFSSTDSLKSKGALWVKIADVGIDKMKKESLSYLPKEYINKYKKFILKQGDYVVALTRPILNGNLKIARIDKYFDNSLLNQRVAKLITEENPTFIFNLLKGDRLIKSIENNIAGTDPPNLSPNDINHIKIKIPSLPEQQKIAAFLTCVDAKITQLTKKKTLLEQYKKGIMQKIFSQELRFKDDEGNNFADWEEKKLGELVKIKSGLSPSKYIFIEKGKNPFLKVEELNNCVKYQVKSRFYTDNDKNLIESNSVIFPKRGAAILTNKVRINKHSVLIDSNLMAIIPVKNLLLTEYIYYIIFNEKLYKIADTSTIPQINNKHIEPYKIELPCIEEQTKIANFLSDIDVKIEALNTKIENSKTFKKGLLQQLFV